MRIFLAIVILAGAARAEPPRVETVKLGERYGAGWLQRFFLGAHWRDAWTTPIEVPVLDLDTFDGGLKPDRLGGGLETNNLHFKSGNGHTWAMRSVDKDPTRVFDEATRKSFVGDIYQDETSTAYPVGALVLPPLLEAAGVLHVTPLLVKLPDDPRLGDFRKFAGMIGLIEERGEKRMEGVNKVEDTISLFERIETRTDERIDARAYLRARLIDILVGDWDRHIDQWRWVRVEDGSWRPVPRDRDQAFSKFDGLIPSVAEYYVPQLTTFGSRHPPVAKVTFSGRYTDRRFLVSLDGAAFDEVAREVTSKVTDAVISEAVHRIPAPLYAQSGASLEQALRARRDELPETAKDFYRLLAHEVDVRGTSGVEEFKLQRNADGSVQVTVVSAAAPGPLFQRVFKPGETSEIRLYTMGGADRVSVTGEAGPAIFVRVVAPGKAVEISGNEDSLKVYETLPDPKPASSDLQRFEPDLAATRTHYQPSRDWGSDLYFFPQLSYDPTRGLVIGATAKRTGYGFELDPFSSQMNFGAAYSTGTNRPRLEYSADFRTRSPIRGLLYMAYSGMDVGKFFGIGNETQRTATLVESGFYNVRQGIVTVKPMIEVPLLGPLRGRVGALFKHASDGDDGGILDATKPEGAGGMSLGSGEADLSLDTRSGTFPSRGGISMLASVRYTPEIFGNPSAFTKARGQVSATFGAHLLTDFQFDFHLAGEKIWGAYPFFEAASVGGAAGASPLDITGGSTGNVLRGYDLNRFDGDAAVAADATLQIALGRISTVVPLRYGLTGLADVGRVFVENQSSSKWHPAVGGGVWLGVFITGLDFQFATLFNATVLHSDEGTSFYLFSNFGL
ncbi:MAG TPA: hypothetical protein VH083_02870 [Myxococcales bacterium]|nr:hypothetical protein [Myxococcales bacterium]